MSGLAKIVTLKQRADPESGALEEDVYAWAEGEGAGVWGCLQPTGYSDSRDQLPARAWGEVPERAMVMYTRPTEEITAGMGVCVDTSAAESCDYRVTGVERWPGHKRAYLAWIPENRRG
jgi:hypothetical protein